VSPKLNCFFHFLIAVAIAAAGVTAADAQDSAPAPAAQASTQATVPSGSSTIRGQVADPTGAVIPGATVVVLTTAGQEAGKATSDGMGAYAVHGLPAGTYSVTATAPGFAAFEVPGITIAAGQARTVNPAMKIQVQQQTVDVESEANTVSTAPEGNANAMVIKGSDLDALSDDPDELQNEL